MKIGSEMKGAKDRKGISRIQTKICKYICFIISSFNGATNFLFASIGVNKLTLEELSLIFFFAYLFIGLSEEELLKLRFLVYAGELSSETD